MKMSQCRFVDLATQIVHSVLNLMIIITVFFQELIAAAAAVVVVVVLCLLAIAYIVDKQTMK